jgi:membrane protease YdiL (CAAX protease family)
MPALTPRWPWVVYLVAALLFLEAGTGNWYGVIIPVAALGLGASLRYLPTQGRVGVQGPPPTSGAVGRRVDREDVVVVAVLYVAIVALFVLAFRVFTQDNVLGLFLCFGGGMVLGVAGPVYYTVWRRRRPLADLGWTRRGLPAAAGLGLLLAAIQFGVTLWRYDLPAPVDWVPLATLALAVGAFEAVFFRGFVQTRLEASFGGSVGVISAAALYAAYHVGYGMGASEMLFLFGLGVVYAIAYATVRNLVVLWPLLIPMGSFYNNLEGGEITMPWAAILGFIDVLALMATAIWLASRHERKTVGPPAQRRQPLRTT